MTPRYKLHRVIRKVRCHLDPGNKCGLPEATVFDFTCDIEVDRLDSQGFIIDQFKIPNVFGKWAKGPWIASCEALAAVVELYSKLAGRATEIHVQVAPTSEAYATCMWRKGMDMPTMVPVLKIERVVWQVLRFGTHHDKALNQMPREYLGWLWRQRNRWNTNNARNPVNFDQVEQLLNG